MRALRSAAAVALIMTMNADTTAAEPRLPSPPAAPVRLVETTVHGIRVVDPYRWMEATDAPEFVAWLKAEGDWSRALLDTRTDSKALRERVAALSATGDEVKSLAERDGKLFYLKRPAASDNYDLFVREGGVERRVLTPSADRPDAHASIDFYEPSPDGRHVAVGISASGSEDSVIRVVETGSGKLLADAIDRARGAMPQWRPDGASFFYMRAQKLPPGAPASARSQQRRNYLHVLGSDPARDVAVFGYGVSPRITIGLSDAVFVRVFPGCPWAIAIARRGAAGGRMLFVAPLSAVKGAETPWHKVADVDELVDDYAAHGDELYLLTHKDAPRGRVVRLRLSEPDLAHAEVILPAARAVAAELAVASDALYVRLLDGGIGRIARVPHGTSTVEPVALPLDGAIFELSSDGGSVGVHFQLDSWTRAPAFYVFDPAKQKVSVEPLATPPADAFPLEAHEVMAKSADGTLVPLSIVHRRGLAKGPHPVMMTAYGNYGVSYDPSFEPRRQAWFERGGIYAVAHVRGGGEFGEEWHQAGMKQHKQRSIDDLVACARYLVEHKLTAPALIGLEGHSAGGITVAGAVTQHPELFGAAIIRQGIVDPLAFERSPLGAANAHEFGSAANADEVGPLYAMSAYYHVTDGTRYPAVMLTAAAHDARVPLWQPAKMAARLQAASASGKPILLRVEQEGGHGYDNGSTNSQFNAEVADCYAFLLWQLGRPAHDKRDR